MTTEEKTAIYEYTVSCGKDHNGRPCNTMEPKTGFGIFKTYEEAQRRAAFLNGRVFSRQILDWLVVSQVQS